MVRKEARYALAKLPWMVLVFGLPIGHYAGQIGSPAALALLPSSPLLSFGGALVVALLGRAVISIRETKVRQLAARSSTRSADLRRSHRRSAAAKRPPTQRLMWNRYRCPKITRHLHFTGADMGFTCFQTRCGGPVKAGEAWPTAAERGHTQVGKP